MEMAKKKKNRAARRGNEGQMTTAAFGQWVVTSRPNAIFFAHETLVKRRLLFCRCFEYTGRVQTDVCFLKKKKYPLAKPKNSKLLADDGYA